MTFNTGQEPKVNNNINKEEVNWQYFNQKPLSDTKCSSWWKKLSENFPSLTLRFCLVLQNPAKAGSQLCKSAARAVMEEGISLWECLPRKPQYNRQSVMQSLKLSHRSYNLSTKLNEAIAIERQHGNVRLADGRAQTTNEYCSICMLYI